MLGEKPVGNKLLNRRWQNQQFVSHRQRLTEVKPTNNMKDQP